MVFLQILFLSITLNSLIWNANGFSSELPVTSSEIHQTFDGQSSNKYLALLPLQIGDQNVQSTPKLPPVKDSEIVIKPDLPHDPDAVVHPPIIDQEMVLDPVTRNPVSQDHLQDKKEPTPQNRDKSKGTKEEYKNGN